MNNKLWRKISVLILSLTMVVTTINLSFAEVEVADEPADKGTVVTEETQEPAKEETGKTTEKVRKETTKKTAEVAEETVEEFGVQDDAAIQALDPFPEADKPTGNTVTYNGKKQNIFNELKVPQDATQNGPETITACAYKLDEGDWYIASSATIQKTDAAEYTLKCKKVQLRKKTTTVVIKKFYSWEMTGVDESEECTVKATIDPKSLTSPTITVNNGAALTYTGSEIDISNKISIKDGNTNIGSSNYTITEGAKGTEAKGSAYTVKVNFKGNYSGEATANWWIKKNPKISFVDSPIFNKNETVNELNVVSAVIDLDNAEPALVTSGTLDSKVNVKYNAKNSGTSWQNLSYNATSSSYHNFGSKGTEKIQITFDGDNTYFDTTIEETITITDKPIPVITLKDNPSFGYYDGMSFTEKDVFSAVVDSDNCTPALISGDSLIQGVKIEYEYKNGSWRSVTTKGTSNGAHNFGSNETENVKITYTDSTGYYVTKFVTANVTITDPRAPSDIKVKTGDVSIKWYSGRNSVVEGGWNAIYSEIYEAIADKSGSTPNLPATYDSSVTIEFESKSGTFVALNKTASGGHAFGKNSTSTENIKLSYNGDDEYKTGSATKQISLVDNRTATNITLKNDVEAVPVNPNWDKLTKEQTVWDTIIDAENTNVDLADVDITYYAGRYFGIDYWEKLDYNPQTDNTHKFGAVETEKIKISFAGDDTYKPCEISPSPYDFKVTAKQDPTLDLNDKKYSVDPALTEEKDIEKDLLTYLVKEATPDTLKDGVNVSIEYLAGLAGYQPLNYTPSTELSHKFGDKTLLDQGKITERIQVTFAGDENYNSKTWTFTIEIQEKETPTLEQKENPEFLYYEGRQFTDKDVYEAVVKSTVPEETFNADAIGKTDPDPYVTVEYYAANFGKGFLDSLWRPINADVEAENKTEDSLLQGIIFHNFGKNSTEKVRITYSGDKDYGPKHWDITLNIVDNRYKTVITATEETVNLKYRDNAKDLAAAIKDAIWDSIDVQYEDTDTEEEIIEPEEAAKTEESTWKPVPFTEDDIQILVSAPLNVKSEEQIVTVRYKGNDTYRHSETTVKVLISKAKARISVKDFETLTYDGEAHWPTITMTAVDPTTNTKIDYVTIVGGASTSVEGFLSIDFSDSVKDALTLGSQTEETLVKMYMTLFRLDEETARARAKEDIDNLEGRIGKTLGEKSIYTYLQENIPEEGLSLLDFKNVLKPLLSSSTSGIGDGILSKLGLSDEAFDNILKAIDDMGLGNGVKVTLGKGPKDAGAYVTTAVSVDKNYDFTMDLGSLIILQKGLKAEDQIALAYNREMNGEITDLDDKEIVQTSIDLAVEKGLISKKMYEELGLDDLNAAVKARILTIDAATAFDWGGHLTEKGESLRSEASIQKNVHSIYIGMTAEGDVYATKDKAPTAPGVYSETVYVLLGNYIAKPITRVFKIQKRPGALEWNKPIEGTPTVLTDKEQDAVNLAKVIGLDKLAEYGLTKYEAAISAITVPVDEAKSFDFGSYLYKKGDEEKTRIADDDVQNNVETLYVGLTYDEKAYFSEEAPTKAGVYTELAYVLHGEYKAEPILRTFRIGRLATRISLACGDDTDNSFTVTYTGKPVEIAATLWRKMPEGIEDVKVDDITPSVKYLGYQDLETGLYTEKAPTDAGTYAVIAKFDGDDNYLASDESAILTIKKVSLDDLAISIDEWWYYGETAPDYEITGRPEGAAKPVIEYAIDEPILRWFYFDNPPTDAGDYIIRVTVPETRNYERGVAYDKFTIKPRPINVVWGNRYLTYNGKWQAPECGLEAAEGFTEGVISGDTVSCAVSGQKRNAGIGYTARVKLAGKDSKNYVINNTKNINTKFLIKPRLVGVEWTGTEFTYDGQAHKPTATIISLDDKEAIFWPDYVKPYVFGEKTDAGNDYVATAKLIGWASSNYVIAPRYWKTLFTINPADVTVTLGNITRVYGIIDKTTENPEFDDLDISIEGLVGDDTANVEPWVVEAPEEDVPETAEPTLIPEDMEDEDIAESENDESNYPKVGTYPISADVELSNNYKLVEVVPGTLTITQRPLALQWSEKTVFDYDGEKHCPTADIIAAEGYDPAIITIDEGPIDDVELIISGEEKESGSYEASAELIGEDEYNYYIVNPTQNFTILDEVQPVEDEEKEEKINTGDNNYFIFYGITTIIAFAGIAAMMMRRKRENK